MGCSNCEPFNTEMLIRGPAQFESVVERVRAAVADGVLEYSAFEADADLATEPSFLTLDLAGPWPDVMQYHFECPRCGNRFHLSVETYHGLGGRWSPVSGE